MDNDMVSTKPTSEGNVEIDTLHKYAGGELLKDKPINRFEDAQCLRIQKAEEEKLLQVTTKLPESVLDKLISDSNDYYLRNSASKSAQRPEYGSILWNKVSVRLYQRKETETSSGEEVAQRVMACCWAPGKPATTFLMLDSFGEVQNVLYAGSIRLHGQSMQDKQCKTNYQQRVQKLTVDHQPQIVVLGAVD